jgi:hypothetical protein
MLPFGVSIRKQLGTFPVCQNANLCGNYLKKSNLGFPCDVVLNELMHNALLRNKDTTNPPKEKTFGGLFF